MQTLLLPYYLILEYILIIKLRIGYLINGNPPTQWKNGDKGVFIIVHGLHEKWNFLEYFGNYLNENRFKILTLNSLGTNTVSIDKGLEILKNFIDKNKIKRFNLICHSKGGIISKLLLNDPKYSKKIDKIINIATPYGGTWLAVPVNQTELLPNSDILKNIKLQKSLNKKILNLYPKSDNHIIPYSSMILDGADNVRVDIVGHTRILFAIKALKIISKYI